MDTNRNVLHNLAKIAHQLPYPMFWTNPETRIMGANQAYIDAAGAHHSERVIGKLPVDYLPREQADIVVEQINMARKSKVSQTCEEIIEDKISGSPRYFTIFRTPITDAEDQVIAVISTSFETTAEREVFGDKIRKIIHDISSPMASIRVMLKICEELPENKRNLLEEAVTRVSEIMSSLNAIYKKDNKRKRSERVYREHLLVSDHLVHIIKDRKEQFKNQLITFETDITNEAHFAFAPLTATQFHRVISNLINNAVESFGYRTNDTITVSMDADPDTILLNIRDTGKGLTPWQLEQFRNRERYEETLENIGYMRMMQVWNILDQNNIRLTIDSARNQGTEIQLYIPRVSASTWIAKSIQLDPASMILILDDDKTIHGTWTERFKPYLKRFPTMSLRHFTHGDALLHYIDNLSPEDKERVVFLSDYELLNQQRNGLQVIEDSALKNVILITGYYANQNVQEIASEMDVKIIPKPMISLVQIFCDPVVIR